MTLLRIEWLYALAGLVFLHLAIRTAADAHHPRRWGSASFWGLLAVLFLFGQWLSPLAAGYVVLALAGLAASGRVQRVEVAVGAKAERVAAAQRFGNRLFLVALVIPGTAVVGSLLLARLHWGSWRLLDPKQGTLISLGLGALLSLGVGCAVLRARWHEPLDAGGRLLQTIGWPLILPQLLAALGGILAQAGAGDAVAQIVARMVPTHVPLVAVAAYCFGMMAFTVCLGNAFAAFPVMTLGLGLPLVVQQHGGDPAIMASLGMLSGYCGTLMTPMAANFNLVPALLLELEDPHAVIKAQVPVGLTLFVLNAALMSWLVFRF